MSFVWSSHLSRGRSYFVWGAASGRKNQIGMYSLGVVPHAGVDVEDVVADEPHEVGKVWHGRLVDDELEHGFFVDAVDVEGERPHGDPNHRLRVVEELNRLGVEGKVVGVLQGMK